MTLSHRIHILQGPLEFPYVKVEGSEGFSARPYIPVTFSSGKKSFRVGHALVDTGSDLTILPLQIAHFLEIELDDSKRLTIDGAGGGRFLVQPSQKSIQYSIDRKGFRSIAWTGIVYFAEDEPIILLGHHQCLEKFDLNFQGPEKKLGVLPRFKF